MKAKFVCNGKETYGEVVRSNFKTVWVRAEFKKSITQTIEEKIKEIFVPYYRVIKRHIKKHSVVFVGE